MLSNYLRCNKDILRRLGIVPLWISQKTKTFTGNLNQPFTENRFVSGTFHRWRGFPKGDRRCPGGFFYRFANLGRAFFSQALCSFRGAAARGREMLRRTQIIFRSKPVLALHQCRIVIRVGKVWLFYLCLFFSSSRTRFVCCCLSHAYSGFRSPRFLNTVHVLIQQSGLFVCFCHNFHFKEYFPSERLARKLRY